MVLPVPEGTSRRRPARPEDAKKIGGGSGASQPNTNKGKKGKGTGQISALNPPFDPRMRRVGSPLAQAHKIKRGWIDRPDTNERVNFLFNPSSLDVAHAVDPTVKSPDQAESAPDVMKQLLTSTASSTGVQLLYDRTYEVFSSPKEEQFKSIANRYGVFADVMAWYKLLGMYEEMPTTWQDTILTAPLNYIPTYLYVGPKMLFYGFVNSLGVTYSHWTQNMIPSRCAINIGFQILPGGGIVGGREVNGTKGVYDFYADFDWESDSKGQGPDIVEEIFQ